MKAEYINSIYQAAQDVFKIMLDVGTQKDDVITHEVTDDGANITIKLQGDLSGTILFSFPKETALEMVKNLRINIFIFLYFFILPGKKDSI